MFQGDGQRRPQPRLVTAPASCLLSQACTLVVNAVLGAVSCPVLSCTVLQVPWYAVLGNHDYGDGIDPAKTTDCAANSVAKCPEGCCYSPVWQV